MNRQKSHLMALLIISILTGCSQEPETQLFVEHNSTDASSWVIKWDSEWSNWARLNEGSVNVSGIEIKKNNCEFIIPMGLDESVQINFIHKIKYIAANFYVDKNIKYSCIIKYDESSSNEILVFPVYEHHPILTNVLPDPDERLPVAIPFVIKGDGGH